MTYSILPVFAVVLSLGIGASFSRAGEEGLTAEEDDAIANIPNVCVSGFVLPGGESNAEFAKRRADLCDENCKAMNAQMAESAKRESLAKSATAVGGKTLKSESSNELRRMINGPANLRDAPDGKVIGTFPNELFVLVEGQKGDWFLVRGYWERPCETGWTHKKNLVFLTSAQIDALSGKARVEAESVTAELDKAFKAYESGPSGAAEAKKRAESGIEKAMHCKQGGAQAECATVVHLLNLLLAQMNLEAGNKSKANEYLLKSLSLPAADSNRTVTDKGIVDGLGPNLTLAQIFLDRGESATVIRYLELSKKVWTKTPVNTPGSHGFSILDKPSGLPDEWIAKIKRGEKPRLVIPGFEDGSQWAWYFKKAKPK